MFCSVSRQIIERRTVSPFDVFGIGKAREFVFQRLLFAFDQAGFVQFFELETHEIEFFRLAGLHEFGQAAAVRGVTAVALLVALKSIDCQQGHRSSAIEN